MVATHMDVQQVLVARGIAGACSEANWQAHKYSGQEGWRYPVYNARGGHYAVDGQTVYRWKNANSGGMPKYGWLPGKPEKIKYYLLPDTLAAIKEANGVCYLASGEPDVMAYRETGRHNVICWFDGEKSVPPTLADDLQIMGVTNLVYCPDRDDTGMISAALVYKALADTEINLRVVKLPGEIGSKFDINKLWQQVNFNRDKFNLVLIDADDVDPVDLFLYGKADEVPQTAPLFEKYDGELPERFIAAVIADVESLPGFKKWNGEGWANFKCPFHDDQHTSAGFNRNTMSFNCYVGTCGSFGAKEYGARRGIILSEYFDDDKPQRKEPAVHIDALPQPSVNGNGNHSEPIQEPPAGEPVKKSKIDETPLYRDSYEVTLELIAELEGKLQPISEPMAFPFKVFHSLGGFAEVMWPGKLVFISGVSGGGKTSLGETFYEGMLREGHDIIWFGPEWDASQMKIRSLQRDGGIDMIALGKLRLWRNDENHGVPEEDRRGANLTSGAISYSIEKLRNMAAWPGRAYYLSSDQRLNSVQTILETIEAIVVAKRAAGRSVKALFFDYLQRAPKSGGIRGWDWQEAVVSQIKSLCERLDLFGFVFIQPTKGASSKARDGETLSEASGQGISDQQCNLYLAITPAFDLEGNKQDYAKIRVVKNSMGSTGEKLIQWNSKKLCWLDKLADVRHLDLKKITFGEGKEFDGE